MESRGKIEGCPHLPAERMDNVHDFIDNEVAVLTQEGDTAITGKLVSTDSHGLTLSVTTTRAQQLGVFKGLSEQHDVLVYLPWFRCRLIAKSTFKAVV